MQRCTCNVFLSGDRNHMRALPDVTVAEIVVLKQVHGDDAVHNVQPTKQDSRSHAEELARLRARYNRRENVVDKVFPGSNPSMPSTLADIGMASEAKSGGKGSKGGKKQAQAEANPPADNTAEPDADANDSPVEL